MVTCVQVRPEYKYMPCALAKALMLQITCFMSKLIDDLLRGLNMTWSGEIVLTRGDIDLHQRHS